VKNIHTRYKNLVLRPEKFFKNFGLAFGTWYYLVPGTKRLSVSVKKYSFKKKRILIIRKFA
jgi:hypothetical protein